MPKVRFSEVPIINPFYRPASGPPGFLVVFALAFQKLVLKRTNFCAGK